MGKRVAVVSHLGVELYERHVFELEYVMDLGSSLEPVRPTLSRPWISLKGFPC